MRLILYTLIAVGGVLVVLALAMVFEDDGVEKVGSHNQSIDVTKAISKHIETPDNLKKLVVPETLNAQPGANTPPLLAINIARVQPDGGAVFAGTSSPKATILIFEGKVILGKTVADRLGDWVIVLEKRLAAGQHLISIAIENKDGSTRLANRTLAIEIYTDSETKPLVAMLPEIATEVPVLIQSSDDEKKMTSKTSDVDMKNIIAEQVTLSDNMSVKSDLAKVFPTAIVWRDESRILISGISKGGMRIIATDASRPFGEAMALTDGAWQIGGSLALETFQHQMKFVLLDDFDKVVARYDLPIKSRDLLKGKDGSPLVVINKGDALWSIAYRRFGDGVRYVDIVRRNQADIVNPDLIYPKQIFVLPKSARSADNKN
ncbi:LysM peptidoglycan-binding domain-containing protein [Candidatus Puniceispirillum sp.]|nr:LysM peptidoglycan-binding domain-containing protein [Candidatus Puniceispirillum sp.]